MDLIEVFMTMYLVILVNSEINNLIIQFKEQKNVEGE